MTWASDGMNDELFISILAVLDAFLAQQIIVQIVDKMFLASHFLTLYSSALSVMPNIHCIRQLCQSTQIFNV